MDTFDIRRFHDMVMARLPESNKEPVQLMYVIWHLLTGVMKMESLAATAGTAINAKSRDETAAMALALLCAYTNRTQTQGEIFANATSILRDSVLLCSSMSQPVAKS